MVISVPLELEVSSVHILMSCIEVNAWWMLVKASKGEGRETIILVSQHREAMELCNYKVPNWLGF